MNGQKAINQFTRGETVLGFYMVKTIDLRTTNANNRYIDLTIADKTGEVNGKVWNMDLVKEELTDGCLVKLKGVVNDWQGQYQLKIEQIRLVRPEDNVQAEDFVPTAPCKPESMFYEILRYVDKINDDDIKQITSIILNDKKEKLLYYPAAMKNHHSIFGGLLYHTLTMLRLAGKVMEVYTDLNSDLLYAGVILHDMSKVDEMTSNELGVVSSYTTEGILLGHIVQGIKEIERVGYETGADKEKIILLEHLVLAHHYEPEFGSPKRPMVPEGEILHYLDIIDTRMYDMRKALEPVKPGEFSDKVWLLHNRRMYRPIFDSEEVDSNEEL